jgi:hypothetical protein
MLSHRFAGPVCTQWRMSFAWDATTDWDGTITKLPTTHRNIKKVCHVQTPVFYRLSLLGKYLLERERLVKENNWNLEE